MEIFLIVLGFLLYILLYTFASFLFNYKIFLVSNDKYYIGAIASGIALFINFSLYAFIPFFALTLTHWWIAIIFMLGLLIGSFLSNAVMSKVDFFHTKRDEIKKEDNSEKVVEK